MTSYERLSQGSRIGACVAALGLIPSIARGDPEHDRRLGVGLATGSLAPASVGLGLMLGSSEARSLGTRDALFGSGAASLVTGFAMFGTGVGFLGRYNASHRAEPWPFGRGASAGYLVAGTAGLTLAILGGAARVFVDQGSSRNNRLRGLGLAGMIVGGNLAIFGILLGAYSVGQNSAGTATAMTSQRLSLGFSGRF